MQKLLQKVPLLPTAPLYLQWADPKELHGVGQYAADAYNIFCRGDWRSVSPTDKDLLKYHRWLLETDGEGVGLLREAEPQAEARAEPHAEAQAEPKGEAQAEAEAQAKAQAEAQAKAPAEPHAEAQAEAKAEAQVGSA